MKKFLAAFAALAFSATSAQAAVIDFVAEAAANPGGFASGTTLTFGFIDVTVSANPNNPFLDDLFMSRPGGLGACITLASNSGFCDPQIAGNDDNIGAGESVTLDFGQKVDISNLSFSGRNHQPIGAGKTLLVNGVEWTFANLVAAVLSDIAVLTLSFGGSNAAQFYVSGLTAVPLPAAAPLLLSGIAGIAFAGRRKRKTA